MCAKQAPSGGAEWRPKNTCPPDGEKRAHIVQTRNGENKSQRIRANGKRNNETFNKIRLIICSAHFYHFIFEWIGAPTSARSLSSHLSAPMLAFCALCAARWHKTILRAERKCWNFLALCVIWIDQCNERTYHIAAVQTKQKLSQCARGRRTRKKKLKRKYIVKKQPKCNNKPKL